MSILILNNSPASAESLLPAPVSLAWPCEYYCLKSGAAYLTPNGSSGNLLKKGLEFDIWYNPGFLEPLDRFFFRNSPLGLLRNFRWSLGLYYNHFTGPLYHRKYDSIGLAPGVAFRQFFNSERTHELIAQFDLRSGWAMASRDGDPTQGFGPSSSNGFNLQPALTFGYQHYFGKFMAGITGEMILSSDSNPFTAMGVALRLGYGFGDPDRPARRRSKPRPKPLPPIVAAQPSPVPLPSPEPSPATGDIERGSIAQALPDEVRITLPITRVSFETGQASLSEEHQRFCEGFGKILAALDKQWEHFEVIGYTDNRGPEQINIALSLKRARAFEAILIQVGVPAQKITSIGMGSSNPRDSAANEKAWRANRRIEIRAVGHTNGNALANAINEFDLKFGK